MPADDRRPPFRSGQFDRGRGGGRPPGSDHGGDRGPGDRPPFGVARPFQRPPTRGGDLPAPPHSVRLREGDRELEVTGAPAFVRQILDDLPVLLGRLRSEGSGRGPISMPAPPPAEAATATPAVDLEGMADVTAPPIAANGSPDLESQIFDVLRRSDRPLAVAAIRQQLGSEVSGQQVRRLLERAGERVAVSAERPATYSLR